jgi:hypothetical protein
LYPFTGQSEEEFVDLPLHLRAIFTFQWKNFFLFMLFSLQGFFWKPHFRDTILQTKENALIAS